MGAAGNTTRESVEMAKAANLLNMDVGQTVAPVKLLNDDERKKLKGILEGLES